MGLIIEESGMRFGEYDEEQVFNIETSTQYTEKLRPNGIKSCEFILLRGKKLCFIEAKKSCPNPTESDAEKMKNYKKYVQDIAVKMKHSLALYSSIILGRHSLDGVPEALKDLSELELCLVLVVKNAQKEWLIPFQDKFRKELRLEMKIWKVLDFIILNEEQARKKRFIL